MVHERARVHSDEDGVGQVGEDDGESNGRRANDSKALRLGERSDTRRYRRFDQFGLKTGRDRFDRFGPQNRGADLPRLRSGRSLRQGEAKS